MDKDIHTGRVASGHLMNGEPEPSLGRKVLEDFVLPGLFSYLYDILIGGADTVLQRVMPDGSYKGRNRQRYSYGSAVVDRPSYVSYNQVGMKKAQVSKPSVTDAGEDIWFETRGQAESVLERLNEILERYPTVSVGDYYSAAGIAHDYPMDSIGWIDLRTAHVIRLPNGGYTIVLPKPINID